jgi:hypothetical protein
MPKQVDARVMDPPELAYQRAGARAPMRPPPQGAWDMRNHQFLKPSKLLSFGIAAFADERRVGRGQRDPTSLDVRPCLTWLPCPVPHMQASSSLLPASWLVC